MISAGHFSWIFTGKFLENMTCKHRRAVDFPLNNVNNTATLLSWKKIPKNSYKY